MRAEYAYVISHTVLRYSSKLLRSMNKDRVVHGHARIEVLLFDVFEDWAVPNQVVLVLFLVFVVKEIIHKA
jgi:hypothetical protein